MNIQSFQICVGDELKNGFFLASGYFNFCCILNIFYTYLCTLKFLSLRLMVIGLLMEVSEEGLGLG